MADKYVSTWEHSGYTIGLLGDGRFEVEFGEGKSDEYDSKLRAEQAIENHKKSVMAASKEKLNLAVIISTSERGVAVHQTHAAVTGLHVTTRQLTFNGYKDQGYVNEEVYPDAAPVAALLTQRGVLQKKLNVIEKLLDEVQIKGASGYGKIDADDYSEMLADLKERHSTAACRAAEIIVPAEVSA